MLCRSLGSRKQVRVDIFAQKSRRSDSTGNSYAKAKVNFRGTCSCDSVCLHDAEDLDPSQPVCGTFAASQKFGS